MPNTSLQRPEPQLSLLFKKTTAFILCLAAGAIVYPRSPLYHGVMSLLLRHIIKVFTPVQSVSPDLRHCLYLCEAFPYAASDPYLGQMSALLLRSPTEKGSFLLLREQPVYFPRKYYPFHFAAASSSIFTSIRRPPLLLPVTFGITPSHFWICS